VDLLLLRLQLVNIHTMEIMVLQRNTALADTTAKPVQLVHMLVLVPLASTTHRALQGALV